MSMDLDPSQNKWKTQDKDLARLSALEQAVATVSKPSCGIANSLAFIMVCGLAAYVFMDGAPGTRVIVVAAVFGADMALNIGANDVANNKGPAVGANALTMGGALVIAAIFVTLGSLIARGDVVSTISGGMIDPAAVADPNTFIWAMMAALIASSLWLNLATWLGASVSTTHAIVGGVMGAGIVAPGFDAVNWPKGANRGLMGDLACARRGDCGGISGFCQSHHQRWRRQDYRRAPLGAGFDWHHGGGFCGLFRDEGLKKLIDISLGNALLIGLVLAVAATHIMRPIVHRESDGLENCKKSLKKLFAVPLIASAALLSFAHGANDVANAVGPLAAIVHAVQGMGTVDKVTIPLWVMLISAFGTSFGLMLFGPKLIRMAGSEITKLNPKRAYCVALSAAITVIVASAMGLPVSSTHVAVGAVIGVGVYHE